MLHQARQTVVSGCWTPSPQQKYTAAQPRIWGFPQGAEAAASLAREPWTLQATEPAEEDVNGTDPRGCILEDWRLGRGMALLEEMLGSNRAWPPPILLRCEVITIEAPRAPSDEERLVLDGERFVGAQMEPCEAVSLPKSSNNAESEWLRGIPALGPGRSVPRGGVGGTSRLKSSAMSFAAMLKNSTEPRLS